MTFFEKCLLVFISVLLSVLANRLLAFLDDRKDRRTAKSKAKMNMSLFARDLRNAIINDSSSETVGSSYGLLLSCTDVLRSDNRLKDSFEKLSGYYHFFTAGGYRQAEHRREVDIEEIEKVIHATDSVQQT
jgi:hypothetical protein